MDAQNPGKRQKKCNTDSDCPDQHVCTERGACKKDLKTKVKAGDEKNVADTSYGKRRKKCHVDSDCPADTHCDKVTFQCRPGAPSQDDDGSGVKWDPKWKQGMRGFNDYVAGKMREAGLVFVPNDLKCPAPAKKQQPEQKQQRGKSNCPEPKDGDFPPAPYQKTVSFVVSPGSPVNRLLVAHRTGLGKTYTMILMAENFYNDPRPIALVFPNRKVLANFYREVMKFPNRYRDFVVKETGVKCISSSKDLKLVIDTLALSRRLKRAGTPGYPAGPLRAYLYTEIGGAKVMRNQDPLFKHGKSAGFKGNPFDKTIIFMDEFHNLYKPDDDVRARPVSMNNLRKAATKLKSAKNIVLVGLTATPVIDEPKDAETAMRLIKGDEYANSETDEGFVSYFQSSPTSVFARTDPGTPPQVLPAVQRVELSGDNLKEYIAKAKATGNNMQKIHYLSSMSRTMRSSVLPGQAFHKKLMTEPASAASKLHQVVKDVIEQDVKTLIMVHRESGFKALRLMWETMSKSGEYPCPKACWMSLWEPKASDEQNLAAFNAPDNKDGSKIRVMIVDSKFYEAGVSFLGVRRLVLVDVPKTWASFMQRVGRVLRFCGHNNLPPEQRTVKLDMYVATAPKDTKEIAETSDEFYLRKLVEDNGKMTTALDSLRKNAVDATALEPVAKNSSSKEVDRMETDLAWDTEDLQRLLAGLNLNYHNADGPKKRALQHKKDRKARAESFKLRQFFRQK